LKVEVKLTTVAKVKRDLTTTSAGVSILIAISILIKYVNESPENVTTLTTYLKYKFIFTHETN